MACKMYAKMIEKVGEKLWLRKCETHIKNGRKKGTSGICDVFIVRKYYNVQSHIVCLG